MVHGFEDDLRVADEGGVDLDEESGPVEIEGRRQ